MPTISKSPIAVKVWLAPLSTTSPMPLFSSYRAVFVEKIGGAERSTYQLVHLLGQWKPKRLGGSSA